MISIAWATGVITVPQSFLTHLGGLFYELDIDTFRLALKDLEDDEEGMPWPKTHNHNTEVTLAGITFARQLEIVAPYTVVFEDGMYGVNLVGANSNIPDVLVRNSVSVNSQNSAGLIVTTVGGVDQATVQAALTAQGYTTGRAPKIDNLDAAVSSRSVPGDGLTGPQAAALALLDVAISSRATPGQGLSGGEAAALASILAAADVPVSTVAESVWARVIEGAFTAEQCIRLMTAVLGGKTSGGGTGTERIRDLSDTKNRIEATVDSNGNRSIITRDLA